MTYDVHLYVTCRVKVYDVEADNQHAAVVEACDALGEADLMELGDNGGTCDGNVEWFGYADEIAGALVDEVGDETHDRSEYHYVCDVSERERDLLEALRELVDRLDIVRIRGIVGHELISKAREAIAAYNLDNPELTCNCNAS